MPELGPYGSVRGARSNARPYRDQNKKGIKIISDASDPKRASLTPSFLVAGYSRATLDCMPSRPAHVFKGGSCPD